MIRVNKLASFSKFKNTIVVYVNAAEISDAIMILVDEFQSIDAL